MIKLYDRFISPDVTIDYLNKVNEGYRPGQVCARCGIFYHFDEDGKIAETGYCETCFNGLEEI